MPELGFRTAIKGNTTKIENLNDPYIKSDKFQLRRGFEINPGEKVLIAEDVTTTGKSIGEVAELVEEHGGEIVGAISIIDRREKLHQEYGKDSLTYEYKKWAYTAIKPFMSLIQLDVQTWKPEDCPLCKKSCDTCETPDDDEGECQYREKIYDKKEGRCEHWLPKYTLTQMKE